MMGLPGRESRLCHPQICLEYTGVGPEGVPGRNDREAASLLRSSGRSAIWPETRGDRRPLLRRGLQSSTLHRINSRRLLCAMLSGRSGAMTSLRRECYLWLLPRPYPRLQLPAPASRSPP
jgi:hypothetical protein